MPSAFRCLPRPIPQLRYVRMPLQGPPSIADWLEAPTYMTMIKASPTREEESRMYQTPLVEAFVLAAREYPEISINAEIMGGAPCIVGTRIPVYMVLDAIESGGKLESAVESYPRLTIQQIKDALGFAKFVVECPVADKTAPAS